MPYGNYGIGKMQQPEPEKETKSKHSDLLRMAITDALNKDLKQDHNAAMGGGRWVFGPQILGD